MIIFKYLVGFIFICFCWWVSVDCENFLAKERATEAKWSTKCVESGGTVVKPYRTALPGWLCAAPGTYLDIK